MANVKYSEIISYLQEILRVKFADRVNRVYFGDIGQYPPSFFQGARNTQKAIIAIAPIEQRPLPDKSTVAFEYREITVRIMVIMNITPFFDARPEEAYGERDIMRLCEDIVEFLAQHENITLDGRVQYAEVGDIDWSWMQRMQGQYLRCGAVEYMFRIKLNRV